MKQNDLYFTKLRECNAKWTCMTSIFAISKSTARRDIIYRTLWRTFWGGDPFKGNWYFGNQSNGACEAICSTYTSIICVKHLFLAASKIFSIYQVELYSLASSIKCDQSGRWSEILLGHFTFMEYGPILHRPHGHRLSSCMMDPMVSMTMGTDLHHCLVTQPCFRGFSFPGYMYFSVCMQTDQKSIVCHSECLMVGQ